HIVDTVPSGPDQQRGGDAVARRHTSEDESLFDVIGVPPPDRVSACLLRGIVEQPSHLFLGQAGGTPRGGRRSEGAGKGVRAATRVVSKRRTAEGHREARTHVVDARDWPPLVLPAD